MTLSADYLQNKFGIDLAKVQARQNGRERGNSKRTYHPRTVPPVRYGTLRLLSEGWTRRDIAEGLGLSEGAVIRDLEWLRNTFVATTKIEIITRAIASGALPLPGTSSSENPLVDMARAMSGETLTAGDMIFSPRAPLQVAIKALTRYKTSAPLTPIKLDSVLRGAHGTIVEVDGRRFRLNGSTNNQGTTARAWSFLPVQAPKPIDFGAA